MTRPDERTPVTIVTGFLGSGKTTLLNRALRSPKMANTAVVINEFGSVPLDHLLTEASNDQIVVLENGCLCCTVFGDLIATLNRLYHTREAGEAPALDRVIIETSGLADPRPVVQAFLSDPTLEGLYRLDSVLAVVDAVNGPGTLERHDEAAQQVALAERILITKLDLLGAEQAQAREADLRERFRRISPAAMVFRNDAPGLDPVELLLAGKYSLRRDRDDAIAWLNAEAYVGAAEDDVSSAGAAEHQHGARGIASADPAGHTHSHDELKIASFCLVREEPTTLYGLELLLAAVERNLGPGLLRLKGLVHVKERPEQPAVIHGAQHLLHNLSWLERWPSADRSTRIVFITKGIARPELVEMVALLDRVAQRTALARERAQPQAQAAGGGPVGT
jgi:G3E family GTPase